MKSLEGLLHLDITEVPFRKEDDLQGKEDQEILKSITVPVTVYIEDNQGKPKLAYNIQITTNKRVIWRPRRFSEFKDFDKLCRQIHGNDIFPQMLPVRSAFGRSETKKTVIKRKQILQDYMAIVVKTSKTIALTSQFLSIDQEKLEIMSDQMRRRFSEPLAICTDESAISPRRSTMPDLISPRFARIRERSSNFFAKFAKEKEIDSPSSRRIPFLTFPNRQVTPIAWLRQSKPTKPSL